VSSLDNQLAEVVGEAERQALAGGLSEHTLYELTLVLVSCEDLQIRRLIVSEVIAAIPEYGDRAMIVALARVYHLQNEEPPKGHSGAGS